MRHVLISLGLLLLVFSARAATPSITISSVAVDNTVTVTIVVDATQEKAAAVAALAAGQTLDAIKRAFGTAVCNKLYGVVNQMLNGLSLTTPQIVAQKAVIDAAAALGTTTAISDPTK